MKKKQKKEYRLLARIVAFLGYVLAMALCVFFALYMAAPAGWTFFYTLAAAPLFSLILLAVTFFTSPLEITASSESSMVYKNEEFSYKIRIRNKGIIPVPAILIKTNIPDEDGKIISASVYTKGQTEISLGCRAVRWGPMKLEITEIRLSDFLNLISLPIYRNDGRYTSSVRVFPDIPDVPCDSPLIRSAAENIRFNDDCEDTKESDSFGFTGGMPGYTHREYVEGDPIRRINWKLSSKKDNYMVRLDDETEAMQQIIVLDSKGGFDPVYDERAVEGVLSIVFSMLRTGFDSLVFFNTKHGFIPFEITEQGDLAALRTAFAEYEFSNAPSVRIPVETIAENGLSGIMLCTPCPDAELAGEIIEAESGGMNVVVVSAGENTGLEGSFWQLDGDFSAELQ